jgi:hypothetical protein
MLGEIIKSRKSIKDTKRGRFQIVCIGLINIQKHYINNNILTEYNHD